MEIEIKSISLDDRLEYLQKISENQQDNTKKFPWVVAIVALFVGAGIVYAVNQYKKYKKNRAANS